MLIVATTVALTAGLAGLASAAPRPSPGARRPSVTVPDDCQPSSDLVALFKDVTSGTVTLPPGTCWTITNTLRLQGVSDLTVNGNDDTIEEPSPPSSGWSPMLELSQDSNLTIDDLNLVGPSRSGNAETEGQSGIVVEADSSLTLDAVDMMDIPGDFMDLYPPDVNDSPIADLPDGANQDVVVTNCTWVGSGYHGVTIEAVSGATFEGDTIAGVHVDAIDMEYDSGIDAPDPLTGPGWPQDDVTFNGDTFANDGGVTLNVANTGSTTVENLAFDGNYLTGSTMAVFDVSGVRGGNPITALTIEGNTAAVATGGPNPNDTIHLTDIEGAAVEDNDFPWYWYTEPAHTADLYKIAVEAVDSTGVDVVDNTFPGAALPSAGTVAESCGNTYLVMAWQDQAAAQASCPIQ